MREDVLSNPLRSDSRYYVTDSLYLAAFLYAHGLWLVNAETNADLPARGAPACAEHADRQAGGKYRFVFRTGVRCDSLVWQFRRAPKAMVDARTFMYAIEELQDRAERVCRIRRD